MVPDVADKGKEQDRQGRHPARPRPSHSDVQLFGVQGFEVFFFFFLLSFFLSNHPLLFFSPGDKVVYRRYASLFFISGISSGDNELITLEIIHRYVEVLDRYFGNVNPSLYHPSHTHAHHLSLHPLGL